MLLSGELAFRVLHTTQDNAPLEATGHEFQSFLKSDTQVSTQDEAHRQYSFMLREIGQATLSCHRQRLCDAAIMRRSIDEAVNVQIGLLDVESSRLLRELRRTQEVSDAHLMHQIRQYFALVKDELSAARLKLNADLTECEVQKRQAKILRDVRIFAHHLYNETRGKIHLSALPRDSAQFKRCKKAVRDNTSKFFMTEMAFQHIKVLAVLKLEHSLISDYLQKIATNMDTGKVKGLFCIVPKGGLHAFCTFGLHTKSHLVGQSSSAQAAQEATGRNDLFQAQWFHTRGALGRFDTRFPAEKLAKESLAYMNRQQSVGDEGSAKLSEMHFSRNCTLSFLRDLPKRDLEEGVFMALCRVLVSRLRTINSLITAQDVREAQKADYDALYSTVNEEYVLLRPEYILPEFVMLVYFTPVNVAVGSNCLQNEHVPDATKSWVPSTLLPPRFGLQTGGKSGGRANMRGRDLDHHPPSIGELLMSNRQGLQLVASPVISIEENNDNDYGPLHSSRAVLSEKQGIALDVESSLAGVLAKNRLLFRNSFRFLRNNHE